jgi:VWFA-related protein
MRSTAPVLIASFLCLDLVAAQETPVFRTVRDAVTVDVLVKRGRHPVAGLTAADFEVFDDGVRQQIASVVRTDVPLMVSFVLDTSHSVRGDQLKALTKAADAALAELQRSDLTNLVTFGDAIRLHTVPLATPAATRVALASLEAAGSTTLYDALHSALVLLDDAPQSHRPMVLVFSDGQDTTSVLSSRLVFETLRRSNAVVYAIASLDRPSLDEMVTVATGWRDRPARSDGPGDREILPGMKETEPVLEHIAAFTGGRYYVTRSGDELKEPFTDALREMRSRYLLTYQPSRTAREGWHELDVRLTRLNATVQARRGYYVPAAAPGRSAAGEESVNR